MEDVSNFDSLYTHEMPRLTPTERSVSPGEERKYFADFDQIYNF